MLLSARRATLQKITAVDAGKKRDSQAGARKECHTQGIYLATRLLPLITQHYRRYSVQPQFKAPFKVRQQTKGSVKTSDEGGSEATCGMTLTAARKRQII